MKWKTLLQAEPPAESTYPDHSASGDNQCCSVLGPTDAVITSEWSSSLQYTDVTGMENGSFLYVVTNHAKVVAVGSQKLLPVTDILPV